MTKRIRKAVLSLAIFIALSVWVASLPAYAHCQIPCGIYDDNARIQSMLEDTETIQKSVRMIVKLAKKKDPQSQNQMVRWIMNKEKHAQNIIDAISDYFLTQRVKPDQEKYTERLVKHHTVIVAAMKTKQHVDEKYVSQLKMSIEALLPYYPEN